MNNPFKVGDVVIQHKHSKHEIYGIVTEVNSTRTFAEKKISVIASINRFRVSRTDGQIIHILKYLVLDSMDIREFTIVKDPIEQKRIKMLLI